MDMRDYLKKVAYVAGSEIRGDHQARIYYSKYNHSYITRVGMEDDDVLLKFMAEHEITGQLTHGVGFSHKEGKWYGWSHRAIYGFKIGSTCNKGDCHYFASCVEDELEAAVEFWKDNHSETKAILMGTGKIKVSWVYPEDTPNEEIRGTKGGTEWNYNPNFGKGEWVAETMEDAKQMAIDFSEGVS